jgi:hypothetical protein
MTQPALSLQAKPPPAGRQRYLSALAWAFAVSNLVRVLTYLPTMLAIQDSGQSDQHSLLTWIGCMAANATMAAWIHEQNGRRFDRAVAMNAANALMCGALALVILWYR